MNVENLKRLKTALTEHKNMVVDFDNGLSEELYYDDEIGEYKGKEIGIWNLKLLLEIAEGKVENVCLKEKYNEIKRF